MRLHRYTLMILAAGFTLGLVLPLDASAQTIRIIRKTGKVEKALEIVKDDISDFQYKPAGISRAQSLEPTDILEIFWEDVDPLYENGIELLEGGEYENAINSLEGMLAKVTEPIFKRYVEEALIRTHVAAGAADAASPSNGKAVQLAQRFLSENDKARLTVNVRLLLGRAQTQSGDHAAAEQTLKKLENEARGDFGQDWEIRAKYWGARNFEAKGNHGEARNLYESLSTTAKKAADAAQEGSLLKAEMSSLARVGLLRQGGCLVEAGEFDDADRYFQRLQREAERDGDHSLAGGAHNGLGMVAFRKGDYKKARFQFLLVSVKYFHDPAETIKALYWIAECYEKLDGDEPGARARAAEYYREVVERNRSSRANSPWAAKAKQKI